MEDDQKYSVFVRWLFEHNEKWAKILLQQEAGFLDMFLTRQEVLSAAKTFVLEIERQFHEQKKLLNQERTHQNQSITTANEKAALVAEDLLQPAKTKLLTGNGSEIIVDTASVTVVDFATNQLDNQPAAEKVTETGSSAKPETSQLPEKQPVQQVSIQPAPLPPSPVISSLKPGMIPQNAPPVKHQPLMDHSKTTFSVSANGKANVEFRGKIEGKNSCGKAVIIRNALIPKELGLSFDTATGELYGVPLQAGDFQLKIEFQFDLPQPSAPVLPGECTFIINPDPKTLWKNEPSVTTDKYWKKDEDTLDVPASDGLRMIAASKRGRSHAHVGSFRDDDFCLMQDEVSGWRVITVADGAGSAKMSRKGSLVASRAATESVFRALCDERGLKIINAFAAKETNAEAAQRTINEELYYLFGNAAKEAVQAIEAEAKSIGSAYKDFSTTLIVTVHRKISSGHLVAAYWVGDGGVGIYRESGEVKVLGKADSGEFAGQTRFLDHAMLAPQEIMNRIQVKVVPDFTAIIAMTDGITDPKFETDANIENPVIWKNLWTELAPLTKQAEPSTALLDWLDFWSQGNHDDRTIAILYPDTPATLKNDAPLATERVEISNE